MKSTWNVQLNPSSVLQVFLWNYRIRNLGIFQNSHIKNSKKNVIFSAFFKNVLIKNLRDLLKSYKIYIEILKNFLQDPNIITYIYFKKAWAIVMIEQSVCKVICNISYRLLKHWRMSCCPDRSCKGRRRQTRSTTCWRRAIW